MKLKIGDILPDFTFNTPFEQGKTLYAIAAGRPVFLMFLRYYGCTVCQLDIQELKRNYNRFIEKGCQVFVVLQSKPEIIAQHQKPGGLPFDIVCDPEQTLYHQLEIAPAKSKIAMASLDLMKKINAAKQAGLSHGEYEGNELQLPALFLLDEQGKVQYAHYAKNLTDMPSLDEMLAMLK